MNHSVKILPSRLIVIRESEEENSSELVVEFLDNGNVTLCIGPAGYYNTAAEFCEPSYPEVMVLNHHDLSLIIDKLQDTLISVKNENYKYGEKNK